MRNARTLIILILLAVFAIAVVLMFFIGDAPEQRTAREDVQTSAGSQQQAARQNTIPGQTDASIDNAPRPTFDVVRVEKDGSVVMAGQAEPGATVIVRSGKFEIGRTTADKNGEWILQKDKKLDQREHGIELSAQSPDGERTLFSKQRLALSLSDPQNGEPLVALTEEGKPTRILQMPTPEMLNELAEAKARRDGVVASVEDLPESSLARTETRPFPDASTPSQTEAQSGAEPVVGFASVDYEDADQKSMIYVSGIGTPGSRVAIYINNVFAGFAIADASGSWNFSDNRQLHGGSHTLRADVLDKSTNSVLARAEVNFEREPETDSRTALFDLGSKEPQDATGNDVTGDAISSADTTDAVPAHIKPKIIVVKKGDTLWHIAEQFYGDGTRYTQIFRNNRNQIRNPHRIYPDQRFVLPDDKPEFTR